MCSKAPVGTTRESLMKSVWVCENALAEEITRKICEAFNWNYDRSTIQYMYANGRYLRAANLEDVENTVALEVAPSAYSKAPVSLRL